jgi:DNA invertase Pin-like site-specific DNA recombinase
VGWQRSATRSRPRERRGWQVVHVYGDIASAKDMREERRPELAMAIAAIEAGDADALVVAKLDRLSRSLIDFAKLRERAQRRGWEIVALDQGIDMTTPGGELQANIFASVAQWERRVIGQRTKDALAAKRRAGTLNGPIGRPRLMPDDIRHRIGVLHCGGMSRSAIAKLLNDEGVPTAAGGAAWYPSTIKRVLDSR